MAHLRPRAAILRLEKPQTRQRLALHKKGIVAGCLDGCESFTRAMKAEALLLHVLKGAIVTKIHTKKLSVS